MAVTATAITTIERAEVELSAATAALNAVATIIAMSIEKDAIERVTLDGKSIDATDATHEVVEDVVIGVAGVGDIVIRPQVKDREVILKTVDRAKRALQGALEAADANTPTAARAAAARRRELEHALSPGSSRSRRRPLCFTQPADSNMDLLTIKGDRVALRGCVRDTVITHSRLAWRHERAQAAVASHHGLQALPSRGSPPVWPAVSFSRSIPTLSKPLSQRRSPPILATSTASKSFPGFRAPRRQPCPRHGRQD